MPSNRSTFLSARFTWSRMIIGAAGLAYLSVGVVQLIAPHWFFENIGYFPPFNRHYVGDLGAFLLPLGIGLLVAARNPVMHRGLIGIGAAASVLHLLNHVYDDLGTLPTLDHVVFELLPLFVLAAAMSSVWYHLARNSQRA